MRRLAEQSRREPRNEFGIRRRLRRRRRILVIDDEPAIVRTLRVALERDAEVLMATDPKEALRLLVRDDDFQLVWTPSPQPSPRGIAGRGGREGSGETSAAKRPGNGKETGQVPCVTTLAPAFSPLAAIPPGKVTAPLHLSPQLRGEKSPQGG